ncbi:fumarylacetoacetate hydrolase family protein [Grosmannia clavigera kw1407]|uniref:Fumarylacetoacetate hydrolase family protein n=1 Tax=Grosmannia clavigera (strain kw1407 / UAMH 11150) TaxID=655863 RepID=F0XIP8_GROCL|nr:fumarylacetoacetate hydrolase family protein [Grosmannia clavigera kw1407]EFX02049.1 fumarylacetoacetate hydrolase family protein [Grosmannia clavigera kw1407]
MKVAWERLIRFVATDGRTLYGEPIMPKADFDLGDTTAETGLTAKVLEGSDIYDTTGKTRVTDEVVTVKKLLGPLTPADVPTLLREAGRKQPPFPSIFFKPPPTVADHGADVVVPRIAQDDQADYEGELVVVLGRDAKDVAEADALDYIAAYTAGNDISSRKWQRDPARAGGVPQWGFSKGFDTYAPLGPVLVASGLVGDPSTLQLKTIVDGELRQSAGLDDLVFSVPRLIAHLSSGTTLQKGSIIMTGTPGGVGAGLTPPRYLVPGTKMAINISKIGTLRNGVVFA